MKLARRKFLLKAAALAATPLLPVASRGQDAGTALVEARLIAAPATVQLASAAEPPTAVWAYNDSAPGPVLRVRQGDRLRVTVRNALQEPTTVHWHGVRVPNAMDGVPYITQPPIEPGAEFVYDFVARDAGTYWYHPHQRTFEQSGRGLHGALIVEEHEPLRVDRDLVWVLGDWKLDKNAAIAGGFGSFFDVSHAGRIGNLVTINGLDLDQFVVRSGERIRLRLVNAANGRVFGLEFRGHRPRVIALDGHPVEPHEPEGGRVVLGPAMRADLILDMTEKPRSAFDIVDTYYPRMRYRLVALSYSDQPALPSRADAPIALPANALAEPDLKRAQRHEIVMRGGAMGDMRGIPAGMAWTMNGKAASCGMTGQPFDPMLWMKRGESCVLRFVNDTQWPHPMHLHGHVFRVLTRNGQPAKHREWLDTVLIERRETVEIAFVADNPGDWMLHCHVLEHQEGGMMACVRVA